MALFSSPSSFGSLVPSPASFGRLQGSQALTASNQMTQDFMRRREEEIAAEKQAQEEQARQAAMAQQQAALPQQSIQPGFNQFGQMQQLPQWAQQFNQQFQPQVPFHGQFGQQMPNMQQFGMPSMAIQPNQMGDMQQALNQQPATAWTGPLGQQQQQPATYTGTNFQAPSGFGQMAGSLSGYFF